MAVASAIDISFAPAPSDIEAQIHALRVAHPQLAAHLAQGVEPAKALRHLGLSAWSRGEAPLAAAVFRTAATLAPDDASLWADLSGAHYACAQPEEARACMLLSLARDDRAADRWLTLAGLHRELQDQASAESAFLKAAALDPRLHDAWVGLGILYFQQRRFREAVEALRRGIGLGSQNVAVHACLGEALYLQGDISGAADAYATQIRTGLSEPQIVQKFAFIRFLETAIGGSVEDALKVYRDIAGALAEDDQKMVQSAFHALSGYGYREAAMRCGRNRLEYAPRDPIYAYLMTALEGAPVGRAPDAYLIRYFDGFAESFDHTLVDILNYRAPEKLRGLLAATGRTFAHCLDAGCGTGLAGPLLRAPGQTLTGVDLSPRMLEKAAARNVYDRLVEAEIADFLKGEAETFDLIFAADVFVYIGDLRAIIANAAQRLAAGGLLAFSVETTDAADYLLLPSGRFAHRPSYVEDVARDWFRVERSVETQIRLDALRPAGGMMFILEKTGGERRG